MWGIACQSVAYLAAIFDLELRFRATTGAGLRLGNCAAKMPRFCVCVWKATKPRCFCESMPSSGSKHSMQNTHPFAWHVPSICMTVLLQKYQGQGSLGHSQTLLTFRFRLILSESLPSVPKLSHRSTLFLDN